MISTEPLGAPTGSYSTLSGNNSLNETVPQVEVVFKTDILSESLRISSSLSSGVLLPIHLTRRGLSEVVNHLLETETSTPFDFLVEVPQTDDTIDNEDESVKKNISTSRIFLRTSLGRFMKRHGLTSETQLILFYVLARSELETTTYSKAEDWVTGLSHIVDIQHNNMIISSASADGACRLFYSPLVSDSLLCQSPSDQVITKVSTAALTDVVLYQHPLEHSLNEMILTGDSGEVFFGYHIFGTKDSFYCIAKGNSDYGPLTSCCLNATSDILATSCSNGKILLWDNASCLETMSSVFKQSESEKELSSNSNTSKKRLRDETSSSIESRGVLLGHSARTTDVCAPKNPAWKFSLLSASLDQTIRIWDIPSVTSITSWSTARAAICVTASPDSRHFATGHEDGRVRVWDIRDPNYSLSVDMIPSAGNSTLQSAYHIHRRLVSKVEWNPVDENLLVSVSHDGSAKIIDLRSPRLALQTVTFPDVKLLCVDWLDEHHFITGGSDQSIRTHYTA